MGRVSDRRRARVRSLIQRTLDELIRDELKDPRIGVFSITEVSLASDLGYANIGISVLEGGERQAETIAVLNRAAPLLRNRLRAETDLRTVPQLRFQADLGLQYMSEIDLLLRNLPDGAESAVADDADAEDGDGEDELEDGEDADEEEQA
jgi:ribosome-binding factor A